MSRFDQELPPDVLARARAGERAAQACIYRSFERAVYTLARRMCGDPDTARDVTQDCFIHAFEHLPQYRGDAPFGRWLRAVAATQALQHLRAQRRFLEIFVPQSIAGDDVGAPVLDAVPQEDLERALAVLPKVAGAVLWLYHVEGYTHPEIARMAGRTVSFSKSQLSRAHQKLRELLAPPIPAVSAARPTPMEVT